MRVVLGGEEKYIMNYLVFTSHQIQYKQNLNFPSTADIA